MAKKIRVGLIGYGKAGKAVANILGTDPRFDLRWIARRSAGAEPQTHPDTDIPIISIAQQSFDELFDQHPVDEVVDFSTPEAVHAYGEALRERGIMVAAIRPPTVPQGTARLRITLSAAHSEADVTRLLEALHELAR